VIKEHGMLCELEGGRWKKPTQSWKRFGKIQKRMPPSRGKETFPVVLHEVVLCSECLCKFIFVLGKVGKPQITTNNKARFFGAKPCKVCEAGHRFFRK